MRLLLLSFVVLAAAGCGSNPQNADAGTDAGQTCVLTATNHVDGGDYLWPPDGGPTPDSVAWNQECSRVPSQIQDGLAPGAFCTIADRCKESPCSCTAGANSYVARACSNGLCTESPQACSWALQKAPQLCQ